MQKPALDNTKYYALIWYVFYKLLMVDFVLSFTWWQQICISTRAEAITKEMARSKIHKSRK